MTRDVIQAEGLVNVSARPRRSSGVDLGATGTVLGCSARTAPARPRRADPGHPVTPGRRAGAVGGYDVVAEAHQVRAADRAHRPVRLRRRAPDRQREPRAHRPAARLRARPGPRRAPESRSASSTSPTPPSAPPRPTPAACGAGSTSPPASSAARGPVPGRAHHRARPGARGHVGPRSALVADGATVLLTTQYLDEADALADEITVIDHGKVIAMDRRINSSLRSGAQSLVAAAGAGGAPRGCDGGGVGPAPGPAPPPSQPRGAPPARDARPGTAHRPET